MSLFEEKMMLDWLADDDEERPTPRQQAIALFAMDQDAAMREAERLYRDSDNLHLTKVHDIAEQLHRYGSPASVCIAILHILDNLNDDLQHNRSNSIQNAKVAIVEALDAALVDYQEFWGRPA